MIRKEDISDRRFWATIFAAAEGREGSLETLLGKTGEDAGKGGYQGEPRDMDGQTALKIVEQ